MIWSFCILHCIQQCTVCSKKLLILVNSFPTQSAPVILSLFFSLSPPHVKLVYYLERVNFTTAFGDHVSFDENGDALPIYDIMNWSRLPNGITKVQNVGVVKKSASTGEELILDEDKIFWNSKSKQVTLAWSATYVIGLLKIIILYHKHSEELELMILAVPVASSVSVQWELPPGHPYGQKEGGACMLLRLHRLFWGGDQQWDWYVLYTVHYETMYFIFKDTHIQHFKHLLPLLC